jgi:hypothetical protein
MDGSRILKIAVEYIQKSEEMWDVRERDGHSDV